MKKCILSFKFFKKSASEEPILMSSMCTISLTDKPPARAAYFDELHQLHTWQTTSLSSLFWWAPHSPYLTNFRPKQPILMSSTISLPDKPTDWAAYFDELHNFPTLETTSLSSLFWWAPQPPYLTNHQPEQPILMSSSILHTLRTASPSSQFWWTPFSPFLTNHRPNLMSSISSITDKPPARAAYFDELHNLLTWQTTSLSSLFWWAPQSRPLPGSAPAQSAPCSQPAPSRIASPWTTG